MSFHSGEWVSEWSLYIRVSERVIVVHLGEWASDHCITPSEQFFSYLMVRTSYISMKWCTLCTITKCLVRNFNFRVSHSRSYSTIYHTQSDQANHYSGSTNEVYSIQKHHLSAPISLCSYALILHGYQRSCKNQFDSLWFHTTLD